MTDSYATWLDVLVSASVLALLWALAWSVPAIVVRRNDLADVAWGLTFPMLAALVGGVVYAIDWRDQGRATVVLGLVTLWGLRLAVHIGRRMLDHPGVEDRRYAQLRARFGRWWPLRSVLQVFVLQAAIAVVVAQPVLIAVAVIDGDARLGWLDAVAIAVVVAGFTLEAVADRQLRRFLARKRSGAQVGDGAQTAVGSGGAEAGPRYLTTGVWAWSRHPNYAGDSILWWGFGLFGVAGALDAGAPWLVVPALVGPLVMFAFLRYGSGVPMTERGRAGNPEWDAYVARTSAFLPRPPTSNGRADGAA